MNNTANVTDTTPVAITVTAHVVADRFVNSASATTTANNNFGKVIVGSAVTKTVTFATTNAGDQTSNALTSISFPATFAALPTITSSVGGLQYQNQFRQHLDGSPRDLQRRLGHHHARISHSPPPPSALSPPMPLITFASPLLRKAWSVKPPTPTPAFTSNWSPLTTPTPPSLHPQTPTPPLSTWAPLPARPAFNPSPLTDLVHNLGDSNSANLDILGVLGSDPLFSLAGTTDQTGLVAGSATAADFLANFDTDGLANGLYSATFTIHGGSTLRMCSGGGAPDLSVTLSATVVPEPASLALLAAPPRSRCSPRRRA